MVMELKGRVIDVISDELIVKLPKYDDTISIPLTKKVSNKLKVVLNIGVNKKMQKRWKKELEY